MELRPPLQGPMPRVPHSRSNVRAAKAVTWPRVNTTSGQDNLGRGSLFGGLGSLTRGRAGGELPEPARELREPPGDAAVDRIVRVAPVGIAPAGRGPGEDLDSFVHGPDRPHVEAPFTDRGHDLLAEHQVAGVLVRDDDPLPPRQPLD